MVKYCILPSPVPSLSLSLSGPTQNPWSFLADEFSCPDSSSMPKRLIAACLLDQSFGEQAKQGPGLDQIQSSLVGQSVS